MSQGLLVMLLKYVGDCPSGPRLRRLCLKVSSSSRVLPTIDNHTTVTRCQKGREIYIDFFFSQSNFAIICDFDTDDFKNSAHVFLPTIDNHMIVTICQKGRAKFTLNCILWFFFFLHLP